MAKYVRINNVHAEPMTRGAYNEFRGWKIPENENPADEGYRIVYRKGEPNEYVSWCPKTEFDAVSIEVEDGFMTFGQAITECQYHCKKIKRKNWNGDGQFVRFEPVLAFNDGKIHLEENDAAPATESECFVFHFKNRITGETGIQVGWLASQADLKAKDWKIVD